MHGGERAWLCMLQAGCGCLLDSRGLYPCLSGKPKTGELKCCIKLSELCIQRDAEQNLARKKKIKKLCGAIVSADRHPINGLKK